MWPMTPPIMTSLRWSVARVLNHCCCLIGRVAIFVARRSGSSVRVRGRVGVGVADGNVWEVCMCVCVCVCVCEVGVVVLWVWHWTLTTSTSTFFYIAPPSGFFSHSFICIHTRAIYIWVIYLR
jgi:hypothetical protein